MSHRPQTLITVNGTGFAPNIQVVLDENGSIPGGDVIFNHRDDLTVTVGADGTFHVSDVVDRTFVGLCAGLSHVCHDGKGGSVRRVDCAIDSCFLEVSGGSDVFGTDLSSLWQS